MVLEIDLEVGVYTEVCTSKRVAVLTLLTLSKVPLLLRPSLVAQNLDSVEDLKSNPHHRHLLLSLHLACSHNSF